MKIDGGCHCGFISYEAEVDPAAVCICHCTDCQTLSGSAFRTTVRATEGSFKVLSGKPKTYVKTAESGNRRVQLFCPKCGTPICATAAGGRDPISLRVGTARQRSELIPKKQIWFRSAQQWLNGLSSVPNAQKE